MCKLICQVGISLISLLLWKSQFHSLPMTWTRSCHLVQIVSPCKFSILSVSCNIWLQLPDYCFLFFSLPLDQELKPDCPDCFQDSALLRFSHSVQCNSLQHHRLRHARLSCPSPSPGVCLKSPVTVINSSSASHLGRKVNSSRAAQWRVSQGPSQFCHLTNIMNFHARL